MIGPIVTPHGTNTHTRAQQAAERYQDSETDRRLNEFNRKATAAVARQVRAGWQRTVAIALVCLLLGAALAGALAYQVMPVQASRVQRVFADINGDGVVDFIVSAEVVIAPGPLEQAGQ